MGYKKNLINPSLYRQFSNSSAEMFDYTMSNLMDNFYDSVMDTSTDGSFKAVCLSGIRTEDNNGDGKIDDSDGDEVLGYLTVVVRPLASFGDILPDPATKTDAESINGTISLHSTVFRARSDFEAIQSDAPKFGQVLNCYFEEGSIVNSEFKTLRFSKFSATEFDNRYKKLATIEGVVSMIDGDWSGASMLGEDSGTPAEATKNGKSSNIKGDRTKPIEYIVIHYSAAGGSKEAVLKYENAKTEYGYHFMVDKDGSHFDTAPPDKIVWHAGGNNVVKNSNSVGLCIMNLGYERDQVPAKSNWVSGKYPNANKQGKWEPYTQASLNKAATLCAQVLKDNNLAVDKIVGHSDIQNNKSDPGPAFDMAAFRQKVKSKMG